MPMHTTHKSSSTYNMMYSRYRLEAVDAKTITGNSVRSRIGERPEEVDRNITVD